MGQSFEGFRVFVYGTLQPGGHYWEAYCEGKVRPWAPLGGKPQLAWPARVRGLLHALNTGYPALVEGESWACGCLLCLKDVEALRGFDALEDYDPYGLPELNEYNRHAVPAFAAEGEASFGLVWTYFMQAEMARQLGGVPLPDGRWPVTGDATPGTSMEHRG